MSRPSFRARPIDIHQSLAIIREALDDDQVVAREVTHGHQTLDAENEEGRARTDANPPRPPRPTCPANGACSARVALEPCRRGTRGSGRAPSRAARIRDFSTRPGTLARGSGIGAVSSPRARVGVPRRPRTRASRAPPTPTPRAV